VWSRASKKVSHEEPDHELDVLANGELQQIHWSL